MERDRGSTGPTATDRRPGDARRDSLVIDLKDGTVAAGPWTTTFDPAPTDSDEVLARYLALVYEMRGLEPGTSIALRTLDVSVLATALALPPLEVEGRLVVLMEPGNRRLSAVRSLLRKRVLLPAAGIIVAATAVGVLVMVPDSDAAPGADLGRSVADAVGAATIEVSGGPVEPEIGHGLTIEREVDATGGAGPTDEAVEVAPEPVEPEIGHGLTVER